MPSSTRAAQGRKSASWVVECWYSLRFIMGLDPQIAGDAQMSAHDIDELGVALRRPHRGGLTDDGEQETGEPQPQTQAERRRQGTVQDRNRTRGAAEQDRLGQRAMDRHSEACDGINFLHHTSTPPPNAKNARKKELAANAIDRPKTIWISRRNPPDVSPNASVRPVVMMMITARILATGPWIDCRIWLSGCSQGMFEPAAQAGAQSSI